MYTASLLREKSYDFLRTNPHLGRHLILIGLAGSYAYGTNTPDSDVDIRGIAVNSRRDILGLSSFEQYVDSGTDTCIYGFGKIIGLLLSCNPNVIELLGLRPQNYLYLHPLGQELLDRRRLFLSKRAVQSFGGYAGAQLRRLQNALARDSYPQAEREAHILHSLRSAMYDFASRYASFEQGLFRLYVDRAENPEYEQEIFADVSLSHYPLRDYRGMWAELNNIVKDYDKLGKRNKKKDDAHLNKHAMHLIRLFLMALDILEKEEICTWRGGEQELLMEIRGGAYQKEDGGFRPEFYELLHDYEKRLERAAVNTSLPDRPDIKRVEEFVMYVNERVVRDEL